MFLSIRGRKAKTATLTLILTFYSGGEEKKGKCSEKEDIFFSGRRENQRRKRRKTFGEDLSRILRSLGSGFGLETFATHVAGAWTERKKMFHGGSFLKLADDDV